MFDRIKKPKGYPFDAVEIGRVVTTEEKERVVAQVDTMPAQDFVMELHDKYEFDVKEFERLMQIARNCHGMIHIFAPDQVEYAEPLPDFGHGNGCECCPK
tara:strand:- start:2008 stop:2307 length:300 start_codon:yes stop_codon:yes gene_type:complete